MYLQKNRALLTAFLIAFVSIVRVNATPPCPGPTATAPSGTGTSVDPYLIADLENLYWIAANSSEWDKYFVQTADIDASCTSNWNSGSGWQPIGDATVNFSGSYDGQGHTVSNLFINRTTTDYVGLFGWVVNSTGLGTISNLGVVNANVTGGIRTGAMIGYQEYDATITNCFSSGTVTGTTSVGGLIGRSYWAIINQSHSSCTVSGTAEAGGLVGRAQTGGSVTNCYATGNVSADAQAGGFVGREQNTVITYCYSTGTVTGAVNGTSPGGFVGTITLTNRISNCFWDTETSGISTSVEGTGKTTAQLKDKSTFVNAGWDFQCEIANGTNNYWGKNTTDNNGYPYLNWEGIALECAYWTGGNSTDWGTATNWADQVVPDPGVAIEIPAGRSFYPTLAADVSVLSLVMEGNINTGSYTLTLGNSTSEPGTLTYSSGHVIGNLKRWFVASTNTGNESGLFPLGDGTHDRFMTVAYTGAPSAGGTLTAHYRGENMDDMGLPINGVAAAGSCPTFDVVRTYTAGFWRVAAADGLTDGTYDITLIADNLLDVNNLCSITALKRADASSPWGEVGNHVAVTGADDYAILMRTGVTGWSDWGIGAGDNNFLPIELSYFTAFILPTEAVLLQWQTSLEVNFSHFEIEKSLNAHDWINMGEVKGSGSAQTSTRYEWKDILPEPLNYYRLKNVDMDGSFSYSHIQLATFDGERQGIKVYPNPNSGTFHIEAPVGATYVIYDLSGKAVAHGKAETKTSIESLTTGMYLIRISEKTDTRFAKVIVQ